jgi:hypothetical protein
MIRILFYLIFLFTVLINPSNAQTAEEYVASGDKYYSEFRNVDALGQYTPTVLKY